LTETELNSLIDRHMKEPWEKFEAALLRFMPGDKGRQVLDRSQVRAAAWQLVKAADDAVAEVSNHASG